MAIQPVASTSRICEVPMPNASAPNAPCVDVCESPQTIVIPGWVSPCSGPITWTIPWLPESGSEKSMPEPRTFASSSAIMFSAASSR